MTFLIVLPTPRLHIEWPRTVRHTPIIERAKLHVSRVYCYLNMLQIYKFVFKEQLGGPRNYSGLKKWTPLQKSLRKRCSRSTLVAINLFI